MSDESAFYFSSESRMVEAGSARLPVRTYGSGPALMLVHGFPLSGFTWRKLLPQLAQHYTCYVPDLPGMGDSQWTAATDFSFPGQGRTLHALAENLGLQRYSVLAQDTGGTFARYQALAEPARIERLMLINTEMPGHRPPWIQQYQFLMGLPGTLATFRMLLRARAFLRSGMAFGGCFCDLDLIDGEFHQQVVQPLLDQPQRLNGVRAYLRGLHWAPLDALAQEHARLSVPVHLIWGADDPNFPLARARDMAKQFPDARLTEITGAKLLVHEEKPAEVLAAVLSTSR